MVDTQDLKSCGHYGCAGSSPAPGTKQDKRSFSTSFFFLEFLKTSLALRMTYMGKVNGVVATVPCSITVFLRKEATGDFLFCNTISLPVKLQEVILSCF
jgi:hypothetical protein